MNAVIPVAFVVDDEKVIADTLAMILNSAGFRGLPFRDPLEALAAAATEPPNLLITDVVMPNMNGMQLAIRFREAYPECKVLLFSGQAATGDLLERARQEGYDFDILAKPVHPKDLLAKLRG
jgi:DNA-binding response OmpR family regulator